MNQQFSSTFRPSFLPTSCAGRSRVAARAGLVALLTLLTLLALIASSLTPALAQDWKGVGRLAGEVIDENNKPVPEAKITLHRQGRPESGPPSFLANKKGLWSHLGLSTGPWKVIIEKEGYLTSEGVAPVSEFGDRGRNKQLTTVLKRATATNVAADLTPEQQEAMAKAAAKTENIRTALEEGNRLLGAGDAVAARAQYEAAINNLEGASKIPVLLGIARTFYMEENVASAITTIEKALVIDSSSVEALTLISSLLVGEGRAAEAEAYLARLPAETKLDPNILLNLGIEKLNKNDLAGAMEHFESVVEGYPDFSDGYYYRGLGYLQQGKNPEAIADFAKLLELDPNSAKAGEAKEFVSYLKKN